MRIFLKILGVLFLLALILLAGAWVWFWGKPVGINNYVNRETVKLLTDSPESLTFAGLDGSLLDRHSHKLADYTRAQELRTIEKGKAALKGLERYGPEGLEGEELNTYKIVTTLGEYAMAGIDREWSGYPITQLDGPQTNLPEFLTERHKVNSEKSAENYVKRVAEFGRVLNETKINVDRATQAGVVAPDFILKAVIADMQTFIEDGADENILVTDFRERLGEMDKPLSDERKDALIEDARTIVTEQIIPGYQALITQHETLLETASHDAGIWRIPDGDKIYAEAVRFNTTTDYTADELHKIGLSEVDRISAQMDAILQSRELTEGSVGERVQALMADTSLHFPNTDEGKEELLAYLLELNDEIMAKASTVFATLPEAPLEIKRVPEFSEASAPGGYYSGPPPFGEGPGTFYINLKDTADNPKWTLPTLLVHEAAPGHHFQIARGMELKGVPMLRKFSPFTAYTEGWALYVERMAAEDLGLYDDDPLGDLGRLQAEMFRAVRLVVDTGMHAKRWSREEAIKYMVSKTGMTEAEVTREIERYVVWPGQALAYKTGQLAILDMRAKAETALGEQFDLKAFHEEILESGALPLAMLDEKIEAWVEEQKG